MGKKGPKHAETKSFAKTKSKTPYSGSIKKDGPEFNVQIQGPLIIFTFYSPKAQHQALARLETFYESESEATNYINLDEAKTKRLCPNYQAFNLPTIAVHDWLLAMLDSEITAPKSVGRRWRPFTNSSESCLLDHLGQVGCLEKPQLGEAPSYLISVSDKSSVPHEASHALYFLHSGYRKKAQQAWDGLSGKCRSIVQQDMMLRGYGSHVWVDEFQAYVSKNDSEFGKKTKDECMRAKKMLVAAQALAWQDLGLDVDDFS